MSRKARLMPRKTFFTDGPDGVDDASLRSRQNSRVYKSAAAFPASIACGKCKITFKIANGWNV